jgi:hypothetical protein
LTEATCILHLAQSYERNTLPATNIDQDLGDAIDLGLIPTIGPMVHTIGEKRGVILERIVPGIKEVLNIIGHKTQRRILR